jgi:hypothetical protein
MIRHQQFSRPGHPIVLMELDLMLAGRRCGRAA